MPAVNFYLRWPNGEEERCYSPSTVIYDYFNAGESLSVDAFMQRAEKALNKASDRVEQRYGYACSSANDQLMKLQRKSKDFDPQQDTVVILSLSDS